jgi:hypothetical protein
MLGNAVRLRGGSRKQRRIWLLSGRRVRKGFLCRALKIDGRVGPWLVNGPLRLRDGSRGRTLIGMFQAAGIGTGTATGTATEMGGTTD